MNSRIDLVRRLHLKFCSWGKRTPTPAREYVGGPVPLLTNPQALNSKRLAIANAILLVLTLVALLINYFTDKKARANQQASDPQQVRIDNNTTKIEGSLPNS